MKKLFYSENNFHMSIFIIRTLIGFAFIMHGAPSLVNGGYIKLAQAMESVGLGFFGIGGAFLAKLIEALGGSFLILGLFTRISAFNLAFVMSIAVIFHYNLTGGFVFKELAHPLELMVVCIGLTISGAGRYSLDKRLFTT